VPERKVRVGVIGTSWWVDLMYVPSLLSHPSAEVVAVCGRNLVRAEEIAAKFGARQVFSDYRDLIARGGCDAVVIAAPDDLHCEMALAAIDAGLHVLCEKPLAGSGSDASLMHERAAAAGIKHMVLFTWRGQPHWRYVKQLLQGGYVGRCHYAEFRFLNGFALEAGYKWRFDGRRANGVTGDLGSHMIDFAQWYLGDVTAVRSDLRTFVDQSAAGDPPPTPVNDVGFLSLEFAGGTRAEIKISAVNLLGDEVARVTAAFYGDEGTLEVDHPYFGARAGAQIRGLRKGEAALAPLPVPADFFNGRVDPDQLFDPYSKQSVGPRQFVDAIIGDHTIETDFATGVAVQRVVDAVLLSSAQGRWIKVGD
jgi:predicted dehydrogenase